MMNSIIAADINNGASINQQVANGSRSSVLMWNIEFAVTENKAHFSAPSHQGKYLYKLSGKEELYNGQKKIKSSVDQNRNTLGNSYLTLNGNQEKCVEDGIPIPKVQLYTGKIHVEWKQVYKIGAGLNNMGNTCFMNTVIQCLTYCPPLANYLLHDSDHTSKCPYVGSNGSVGFCMMCLLQRHMKRAIGKSGDVIKPLDVYQRLKLIAKHFQYGRQEDAHEFLRYVIDNLWKSCLSQNNSSLKLDPASKETTVINQIFGGYHRSQVTCMRCKEKSNTFDHFMDFILDIKQNVLSLEKALEKFTQPELLQQENSYKCPKCKMKVAAQKRFSVYRAPNVATFQLKRFDYHRSFGGKITKQITYPEKLNLRPFMSETKGDPVWYRLNAVLVHSGPSCNSGHYYCYVKNSNGFWYVMDDQKVHQVSLNQVLNQSAYVLFYIKMEASEGSSLKKCLENRNSLIKGNVSSSNCKKMPDISSLKSSVLSEVKQATMSSPSAKHQIGPSNNVIKKLSFPQNQNKERISFGIRPSMPNLQELHKSSGLMHGTAKKVKQSVIAPKASSNHCGLVPYMEDSSESSDEDDNVKAYVTVNPKVECIEETSVVSENINNGAKPVVKSSVNDNTVPHIEIKAKLSKSVLNISKTSSSNSNFSNTPPKVIATGSWTVTEADGYSPSICSGSSSHSVNSTTDWHVTSTDVNSPIKKTSNKLPVEGSSSNKENGLTNSLTNAVSTAPVTVDESLKLEKHCSFKQTNSNVSYPPSQGASSIEHILLHGKTVNSSNSPAQKCNFRKHSESEFLENAKKHERQGHGSSFLKRKCSDSYQEVSSDSPEFPGSEGRYCPLSKKTKCSQEYAKSISENDIADSKLSVEVAENYVNSGHDFPKSLSVHTKITSNFKSSTLHNGISNSYCDRLERTDEKSKVVKNEESDSGSASSGNSSSSSSSSSLEYEWVERTKDSIEKDHQSSKGKSIKNNDYQSSSSTKSMDRKKNVVSELNKNSSYFYGTAVPTWKGENRYKELSVESRKSYPDSYDDEFDRGKVRKSKPKDRHENFYKHNPFQRYADRYYGHSKFNGKFYYNHHHRKPYDTHHQWKRCHSDNFQRHRGYYRRHFQR